MITKLYSFHHPIQYGLIRLLPRVLPAINCAKVSHAQLPDIPLQSGTQALRLIASIPLILRGKSVVFAKKKHLHVVLFPHLCT